MKIKYKGMKLNRLGRRSVLREYGQQLNRLWKKYERGQVLSEGRRIVTTVEIHDDDDVTAAVAPAPVPQQVAPMVHIANLDEQARQQFITDAQRIGNFTNSEWVDNVVNGMKQAGIHGFNEISEGERPVTQSEIRQLIELLVEMFRPKKDGKS